MLCLHTTLAYHRISRMIEMSRCGKPYKDKRNWKGYNEELVIRGKFIFDLDFVEQWEDELIRMNQGKRGSPYRFPASLSWNSNRAMPSFFTSFRKGLPVLIITSASSFV